jgi:hypothetical protein
VQLFSSLRYHLSLERAALLLPDPTADFYVPWALVGYDRTTERRLRIPDSVVEELARQYPNMPVVANDDLWSSLRSYFSTREQESDEQLLVFPMVYEGKLQSVFLISASPYLKASPSVLTVILSAIGEAACSLLYEHRQRRFEDARRRVVFSEQDLRSSPQECLGDVSRQRYTFIRIELDPLLEEIAGRHEEADWYRLRQDAVRIVSSMVANLAATFELEDGSVLVVASVELLDDGELVVHQLRMGLQHVFRHFEEPPVLRHSIRTQGSGEAFADAVRSLLSA